MVSRSSSEIGSPLPGISDATLRGYILSPVHTIGDQIDRLLPTLPASGKLASSDSNELEKVCDKFLSDKSACKNFVGRQEFLSLEAKKRAEDLNTLPTID